MSETVTVEAIKTVPSILWVVFATLVFLALRRAILPQLGRLSTVKTPVFEASFAEKLLDEAAKAEDGPPSTASERRAAVSRLEHALGILKDGRVLWADDRPELNAPIIRLLQQLDMTVDTVRSTAEALSMLRRRAYDIVITDMHRDTEEPADTAGMTLLNQLERYGITLPVIVYAARFDPQRGVHRGIFAYTNRADDVVQYIIDLMERIKFGAM